jgi:hypothetical protein
VKAVQKKAQIGDTKRVEVVGTKGTPVCTRTLKNKENDQRKRTPVQESGFFIMVVERKVGFVHQRIINTAILATLQTT